MKGAPDGNAPANGLDVLFIVTGLTVGGAEIQVTDLAVRLAASGNAVGLLSLVPNGEILRIRLANSGVKVFDLNMHRGRPSFRAFVRAARIVKHWRPRLVHSHMFHSNLLARLVRLVTPMPVLVCSAHNSNEGGVLRMLAYRATHGLCDLFTNVTEIAARDLERRGAARHGSIVAQWNGIDTDKFRIDSERRCIARSALNLKEGQFVYLAAGRLAAQKDYATLLSAMKIVAEKNSTVRLLIAGEGELAPMLMDLTESLGISSRVTWLGAREDVNALMNAADAFVLSSLHEGFGLVIAEAMASGLPVVSTRCNGPEEVLGGLGFLVEPSLPGQLAETMLKVASMDAGERMLLGRAASDRANQEFSLTSISESWHRIYARLGVNLRSLNSDVAAECGGDQRTAKPYGGTPAR